MKQEKKEGGGGVKQERKGGEGRSEKGEERGRG